ncbi:zinc ABC transporter substrate-binding protein [Vibrio hannami]|uniref:zinc ABC transporter substrate-binding protein n=1 Tax=Vibrio hannami TaxID=2717094 RepID=UPI00240F8ECA|nr:zinc ABC transporter substrate-binding protein [Vibrio hannami]MDG3088610.1 zinc ABC transporter substrate-binding protein [Vibrio hannami]
MKRLTKLMLALMLVPAFAHANPINVTVSVKPIQLIVKEITQDTTNLDLLVSTNASPHDYALKPSDIKKIKGSDLVIWFGPELEPFLEKVLQNNQSALPLSSDKRLVLREFGSDHVDDGHNHGTHDPHVWLGPDQAKQIARIVTDKLSELDTKNQGTYEKNYKKFVTNLDQVLEDISNKLEPVKNKGYYVFHDAYGYFEEYFSLNHLGKFTVSPERKPGAKTLIKIKTTLRSGDVQCVFSEPQFKPTVIASVTRGSDVNVGQLDPLATDIVVKKSSYFTFLNQLSDSFYECLSAE